MTDKPRYRQNADGQTVLVGDSLSNVVAGLGQRSDKRAHNRFTYSANNFDFAQLEAAYQTNWIARQIVNVPVDDGLREWREFSCEEATEIRKEEKRLGVQKAYKLAKYWSRLYGGAAILMITDQDLGKPLDVERISKGSLKRLVVLDRWELSPQYVNFTNPLAADYLLPEYYSIRSSSTQLIHSSHLIRIDGEELPRRLREWNETWGDSTLRKVLEDLQDVAATKGGIASLVLEANVDTITRNGLSDELASGEEASIMKRYSLYAQMKSMINMGLLDGEEKYERNSLSFSGLGEIMDRFMIWISGAAEIPMTRLFGMQSKGMGDSGQGDLNNYYDAVASMQESQFRPDLEALDEVIIRSALGDMPEDCEWEWKPLYQESGVELAQQELAAAQSDDLRLQQGVVGRSHIARRLKQEGKYALKDEEIDRMERDDLAEANGEFDPEPEEFDLPELPGGDGDGE